MIEYLWIPALMFFGAFWFVFGAWWGARPRDSASGVPEDVQ